MKIRLKKKPVFLPRCYQGGGIELGVKIPNSGLLWQAGLGKTASTLAIYDELKRAGEVDKLYILAPPSVAALVWPDAPSEFRNFEHLTTVLCHGPKKQEYIEYDVDIYILTYNALQFLLDNIEYVGPKDMLVFDESTKVKNTQTKRFKIVRKIIPFFSRRMILTGSFTTNGIMDLFGQMVCLDEGKALGEYITHFRNAYFRPAFDGWGYDLLSGSKEQILTKIDPLVHQLSGDDILSLPGLIRKEIYIELPPKARRIYNDLKDDAIAMLEAEMKVKSEIEIRVPPEDAPEDTESYAVVGSAAQLTAKLLQVASGGLYTSSHDQPGADKDIEAVRDTQQIHDEKTKAVVDLMDDLSGECALIMYKTLHDLARLQKAFPNAPVFSGKTPKQLKRLADDWNAGLHPVVLGHPASMAHGLNLQFNPIGRSIIWYSTSYDLEFWQQANARLFRSGQKQIVFVYVILAKRTLDPHVLGVIDGKKLDQESILAFLKDED